jgi:deoxyadenosine/deoxycytidine kinase
MSESDSEPELIFQLAANITRHAPATAKLISTVFLALRIVLMVISIEGCLGAGKTTVARGLATYRNSELLLEEFEKNPFLNAFYEDPAENATETEFAFLMLHFHQLKKHLRQNGSSEVIADFHIGKDLIYADLNLKESRAKQLFGDLYQFCLAKVPSPSVIIFLSAPTELLIERIQRRNRHFEVGFDPAYYDTVNAAYENYFKRYSGTVLRIPMSEWDFVADDSLYRELSRMLDRELSLK